MVTNPFFKKQNINAFINLFKYAQQFYGQKMKNEFSFSMFYSEPPYADSPMLLKRSLSSMKVSTILIRQSKLCGF